MAFPELENKISVEPRSTRRRIQSATDIMPLIHLFHCIAIRFQGAAQLPVNAVTAEVGASLHFSGLATNQELTAPETRQSPALLRLEDRAYAPRAAQRFRVHLARFLTPYQHFHWLIVHVGMNESVEFFGRFASLAIDFTRYE